MPGLEQRYGGGADQPGCHAFVFANYKWTGLIGLGVRKRVCGNRNERSMTALGPREIPNSAYNNASEK